MRREGDPRWQPVEPKVARLGRVVAGPEPPAHAPCRVEDQDGSHPGIIEPRVDSEQAGQASPYPGLLGQLPHRAPLRGFAVFQETRRKTPGTDRGPELAPHQQHALPPGKDDTRRGRWIPVEDESAARAGRALPPGILLQGEPRAALGTIARTRGSHKGGSLGGAAV